MEKIKQTIIAERAGISDGFLSQLLSGRRRPSWRIAKKLASITNTKPELWLDASPETIRTVLNAVKIKEDVPRTIQRKAPRHG
jgi:transcriptional regulator with XRE-family HTH domain